MDRNNKIVTDARKAPIRPWPCRECRFLREAKSKAFGESYKVCGWWDEVRVPFVRPFINATDASRSMNRKQVYGPHTDEAPHECATFQPVQ